MSALDNLGGNSQPGGVSALDRLGTTPNYTPSGVPTSSTSQIQNLYSLAQQHGGSVAEAANELVHPQTSILSTMSDTFKKAFTGFVDVLSVPSEAVAGLIDPNMSVSDAIKTHERMSDVVFGKRNPNMTTVGKVGDFFVRTATDILTDPLTYLTFGGSAGVFGLKALPEVTLGLAASQKLGLVKDGEELTKVFTKGVSAGVGEDLLKYSNLLVKQAGGKMGLEDSIARMAGKTGALGEQIAGEVGTLTTKATTDAAKTAGKTITDFEGQDFKNLMKTTLESPLNIDYAKKAFSNLLENNPGLAQTLVDKGGVKFFGKTVVSSQRIASALQLVPGMKAIDELTTPTRMALGALFNPSIIKTANGYQRIPEEMTNLMTAARNFKDVTGSDTLKTVSDLLRTNEVTVPELSHVMDALSTRKVPADPKLANIYMRMMDMNASSKAFVEARGGHIGTMENHVGLVLNPTDTKKVSYAGKPSGKIGAAETAAHAKFIAQTGQNVLRDVPTLERTAAQLPGGRALLNEIGNAGSVQDVGFAIGRHTEDYISHLQASGKSVEQAMSDAHTQSLLALRHQVDRLPQNAEYIGRAEAAISKATGEVKTLAEKEADAAAGAIESPGTSLPMKDQFFQDNAGTIFKRVGTTAAELKSVGIEGFDTNLATSMATRFLQNINQGITHEFVNNLGSNFGMLASEAPTGWVPLEFSKANEAAALALGKQGEQILYHPTIAAAAQEMFGSLSKDPATGDFLKFYDKLQSYWKGSVTSIFPQFHGRNAVSNVLLNFLDLGYHVFNPATHTAAIDLLNKDRVAGDLSRQMLGSGAKAIEAQTKYAELMGRKVFTDATGQEYTFGELRSAMKQHDVAFRTDISGQADIYNDRERMFTNLAQNDSKLFGKEVGVKTKAAAKALNPFTLEPGNFAPVKYGRVVGNAIESQARIVNFLSNLRATGDVLHAAQRTKMFLFDYQNLSNFERSFMRRVLPFYTFTRKNLELQVNTLLSTPGRIESQLTALNTLGETLSGGQQLTPAEQAALPDWIKSGIGVLANRRGSTVNILTGFGTPIEQPFQALQSNQLMGAISPLIRLPVEQASGYSFFQGKMLSDVTNAAAFKDAPAPVRDFIGFTKINGRRSDGTPFTWYESLHPENMNLVLNMPFGGRVLSALKQMQTQDVSTQYKTLQQVVGVRPYSFDVVQEQAKRDRELQDKLSTLLTKAGITAQFTKTYVPKY